MSKNLKNIYVFDVDDTLIGTTACIRAINSKGETVFKVGTKVFNAPDSTERLLAPGLVWDFTEFESLDQLLIEPKLPTFGILANIATEDPQNIHIVTARQCQHVLHKWLLKNCIEIPLDNIHCFDANRYTNVAQWKADEVSFMIDQNCKVYLWEDDQNNIESIRKACEWNGAEFRSMFQMAPEQIK